jgi:hypothetical protein
MMCRVFPIVFDIESNDSFQSDLFEGGQSWQADRQSRQRHVSAYP